MGFCRFWFGDCKVHRRLAWWGKNVCAGLQLWLSHKSMSRRLYSFVTSWYAYLQTILGVGWWLFLPNAALNSPKTIRTLCVRRESIARLRSELKLSFSMIFFLRSFPVSPFPFVGQYTDIIVTKIVSIAGTVALMCMLMCMCMFASLACARLVGCAFLCSYTFVLLESKLEIY